MVSNYHFSNPEIVSTKATLFTLVLWTGPPPDNGNAVLPLCFAAFSLPMNVRDVVFGFMHRTLLSGCGHWNIFPSDRKNLLRLRVWKSLRVLFTSHKKKCEKWCWNPERKRGLLETCLSTAVFWKHDEQEKNKSRSKNLLFVVHCWGPELYCVSKIIWLTPFCVIHTKSYGKYQKRNRVEENATYYLPVQNVFEKPWSMQKKQNMWKNDRTEACPRG